MMTRNRAKNEDGPNTVSPPGFAIPVFAECYPSFVKSVDFAAHQRDTIVSVAGSSVSPTRPFPFPENQSRQYANSPSSWRHADLAARVQKAPICAHLGLLFWERNSCDVRAS